MSEGQILSLSNLVLFIPSILGWFPAVFDPHQNRKDAALKDWLSGAFFCSLGLVSDSVACKWSARYQEDWQRCIIIRVAVSGSFFCVCVCVEARYVCLLLCMCVCFWVADCMNEQVSRWKNKLGNQLVCVSAIFSAVLCEISDPYNSFILECRMDIMPKQIFLFLVYY